jgi:2-methylcitrate dehydratase PrpD
VSWSRRAVRWAWKADPPGAVRHAAKRHLLDGLGCAIAASRRGAVPYLDAILDEATAPEHAGVIGTALRRPAPVAAFANGVLTHALDFDDTHAGGLVHATAVVLPTVLAEGERTGADGRQVVEAAVVGYELVTRIAAAVPHGFHRRGFHATSVAGVLAAAVVAAKLRGCDEDTAVRAVGIAGSMASGSLAFLGDGSSTKQLHPGWAAASGLQAVSLALGGASGPEAILEDPANGFYRAFTDVLPEDPFRTLDEVWETEAITIKPYPSCQLMHASLDALHELDLQHDLRAEDIEHLTFSLPPESEAIVCRPSAPARPRTAYDARFSLPWCAATLLHDRELTLASFDHLERPEVDHLAARVTTIARPHAGAAADAPGHVEVRTRDGSRVHHEVASSRGGPQRPLSDGELEAKALHNGAPRALVDAVLRLESAPDLQEVRACLRP